MKYDIDKRYLVPKEEITCPGCVNSMVITGQKFVRIAKSAQSAADVKDPN